ncbi:hypothetical protein KM043_017212 [Ampulex compressa]|nr:hypothetical protein KM043_017212 [Ampulex compressa]
MADISYIQKKNLEDANEAMEGEDEEEGVNYNLDTDGFGTSVQWVLGTEYLHQLEHHAISEYNYNRCQDAPDHVMKGVFRNRARSWMVSDYSPAGTRYANYALTGFHM